jgi:hypothetical protein
MQGERRGRAEPEDGRLNEIVGLCRKFYETRDRVNGTLRRADTWAPVGCSHDANVSVTFIEK